MCSWSDLRVERDGKRFRANEYCGEKAAAEKLEEVNSTTNLCAICVVEEIIFGIPIMNLVTVLCKSFKFLVCWMKKLPIETMEQQTRFWLQII